MSVFYAIKVSGGVNTALRPLDQCGVDWQQRKASGKYIKNQIWAEEEFSKNILESC